MAAVSIIETADPGASWQQCREQYPNHRAKRTDIKPENADNPETANENQNPLTKNAVHLKI
jgi:hypothetical protein